MLKGRHMKKRFSLGVIAIAVVLIIGTLIDRTSFAAILRTNISVPGCLGYLSRISEDGNIVVFSCSSHNIIPNDPYANSTTTTVYEKNIQTGNVFYVSVDQSGAPVDTSTTQNQFALSRTGRYVAYSSANQNIVTSPALPNNYDSHVFLRDTLLGTTKLVDQSASGALANTGGHSNTNQPRATSVSDDGRFVTFSSVATNLLVSDNPSSPNYAGNSYVKDMQTGAVINPLTSSTGVRSNGVNGYALASCDGSILAFSSSATNLTAQDNGKTNTYLVDLRNGQSIANLTYGANNGANLISVSCNGRYIIMSSNSTNLTPDTVSGSNYHFFRYDRLTGEYKLVDKSSSGYVSSTPSPCAGLSIIGSNTIVSDNGRVVFCAYDHSMVSPAALNSTEVYLSNPDAGTTELVPINSTGVEQNAGYSSIHTLEINARGDSVIYDSSATNLVDGYAHSGVVISKVQ